MTVAVNLSARQFQQQDLVEIVARILKETGLEPRGWKWKSPKASPCRTPTTPTSFCAGLKDMGIRVALDDFGTGYSSLSYLKKFPIDTLKIDQSFVRDLITDPNDAAIANAVIVLAHSLKLKVVAEGVETREQEAFLREHQCDLYQGFLFSSPVPADAFEILVRKHLPKTA